MQKKTKNGLIVVAIMGIAGYFVYTLIKKKGTADSTNPDPNNPDNPDPANPDPNNPDPVNPPAPATFAANKIATDIFNAMDGYGTNEDDILTAFRKVKSNANFDALVSAFGTRTLNCGTGNPFCDDFTGNLSACLYEELSQGWIDDINTALRSNGVTKSI